MTLRPIRRALLAPFDKTGLAEFAVALAQRNVTLISTGGTAKVLRDSGLTVTDVSEITEFPEIMDGRVKTLHPKIHGGLLARRDILNHAEAMRAHGIEGIDLLVAGLYPFEAAAANGADFDQVIENIDIGGPAMIRAAAKNHDWVTVIVDPEELVRHGDVVSTTQTAAAGCRRPLLHHQCTEQFGPDHSDQLAALR